MLRHRFYTLAKLVVVLLVIISILGLLIVGPSFFTILPVKIYNKKVLSSSISMTDICYTNSLKTDENGILQSGSKLNSSMAKQIIEKVKNKLLSDEHVMDYFERPFNVTMDYGEYKREIIDEPEIIFKTYESKNLMMFTFPGKVYWYVDSAKVETVAVDSNFYFVAYNVACDLIGNLSYDFYTDYISDKSFEKGYSLFEHKFRSSPSLDGHILYNHNKYDYYVESEIFGENDLVENLDKNISDISKLKDPEKQLIFDALTAFSAKKCQKINYGKTMNQFANLNPKYIDKKKYVGSTLYSGSGNIKLNKSKLSFSKNLYICKFSFNDYGYQIIIIPDCEIKDGKMCGDAITYSNYNSNRDVVQHILQDITEYSEHHLEKISENNINRWKYL